MADEAFPNGHYGHLNAAQTTALAKFKEIAPSSIDELTLLRYLRARKWDPAAALVQLKDTEKWRADTHLDLLYSTINDEAYLGARALYPQWTGRRDKRGIPLFVYHIGKLDTKTVSEYEKANDAQCSDAPKTTPLVRLFALYENLINFTFPLCTQIQAHREESSVGTPITMSTNIVDVTDVSLRMFWNLKGHMQAASTLATAHYPETLDRIFVIGAPSYFGTVWGWIKRWFDPVTVSKIFILAPEEVHSKLSEFIDPENIPKAYGGQLDYAHNTCPKLEPDVDITFEPGWTDLPTVPAVWVEEGDRLVCYAKGKAKGSEKARNEKVCSVPLTFRLPLPSEKPAAAPAVSVPVATANAATVA